MEKVQAMSAQGVEIRARSPLTVSTVTIADGVGTVLDAAGKVTEGDVILTVGGLRAPVTSAGEGEFTYATEEADAASAPISFYALVDVEAKTFSGPGGSASIIDATTLASKAKRKRVGLQDNGQLSFTVNYDPSHYGHQILFANKASRAKLPVEMTFTDTPPTLWDFDTYVMGFSVGGSVDGLVEGNVTLEIDGDIFVS